MLRCIVPGAAFAGILKVFQGWIEDEPRSSFSQSLTPRRLSTTLHAPRMVLITDFPVRTERQDKRVSQEQAEVNHERLSPYESI